MAPIMTNKSTSFFISSLPFENNFPKFFKIINWLPEDTSKEK
jgi:hypothetical protein